MARVKPNPDEVQRVLDQLSAKEIEIIKKENPFRAERNAGIQALCKRGVKASIIAEISGFCDTTITRIRRREYKDFD